MEVDGQEAGHGMMEPQVEDLEDDSINFWASLDVHAVDQMQLHGGVQIVDQVPALVQSQSVCKELFPVDSDPCLEPRVGMEFESGEAAKTFYIAYAGRVGFSVRIARSRRSKCNESVIMLRFVCSKEGFSKEKHVVAGKKTRKRPASIREGCNAMLEVLRRGDSKWIVTKLVKEHNHEVGMPSRVHYIAMESDAVVDPYIGMEFESVEAAKTFYYSYATRIGFEARVRQSRKSQDESLKMLKLVCSRHRYHSGRETNGGDTKRVQALDPSSDGCDALFEIIRKDRDAWTVSKLILEHTHELNPAPTSRVRCIRSQGESLYDIRRQWAPAYTKKVFCARNLLPQSCQNLENVIKKHFSSKTQLRVAVQQLGQAVCNFYEREAQGDYLTTFQMPELSTASPIEKQASLTFTRSIFDKFQEQFVESFGYHADRLEDAVLHKYRVTVSEGDEEAHIVSFNPEKKTVGCSCCLFESCGILCRHALRVFIIEGVRALPKAYILKRWTKHAKSIVTLDDYIDLRGYRDDPSTTRYNDLHCDAIKCAKEGSTSSELYSVAKEALHKALDEVVSLRKIRDQQNLQSCITSVKNPIKKSVKGKDSNHSTGKSLTRLQTLVGFHWEFQSHVLLCLPVLLVLGAVTISQWMLQYYGP
ncbi:hypothetical protein E2562_000358 [Oryza meyeriana var. granulata]|uniref:Protein FAR1-RELATED SEQUENCE n=1 Tax=Oryza meyeriana var. granulata TaxID=110450 RepID=A0A6G1CAG5_9ORYZ|nr:hypothetical protein E2562_000358 [Oryza meyeriana var. granulata]